MRGWDSIKIQLEPNGWKEDVAACDEMNTSSFDFNTAA